MVILDGGGGVEPNAKVCSKAVLIGRCCRLLGGLYGGGGTTEACDILMLDS